MDETRMRCPNCGFEVVDEGVCSLCGHEMDQDE
jgi:DNA-directed RNA polymerase subunit RPC12/RpoP